MALSDLIEKIVSEANKKAAFMKQVSDGEVKKILEEANKKAELQKEAIDKKADEKSSSVLGKAKILASMESRSELLKGKREIIDSAYTNVLKGLREMDSSKYTELIAKMLKTLSGNTSSGSLLIPVSRKKETEQAIKDAKVSFEIKDSTDDFAGGFILFNDDVEFNFSFSYLINKIIRPTTELDVAQVLFS